MIKYFYYERHFINDRWYTKNEEVLYERPRTGKYGWKTINIENGYKYIIDVKKYLNEQYEFDEEEQEVYDKLILEQRNKKLETL